MSPQLGNFSLKLGTQQFVPLMIGGMGVDISTSELALEAARLGALGHISDAMMLLVADRRFGTHYSSDKQKRFDASRGSLDKGEVKFDLTTIYDAQRKHVEATMQRKSGSGLVLINIMEKLSMGAPRETLEVRLRAALDGGIDGITLSAGLHTGSLGMIKDHPRFKEAKIGIIVSSARALKIFLKTSQRYDRMPDYIVVEGPLAGGHLGFGQDWKSYNLQVIVDEVLDLLKAEQLAIPVIPAGGIFTGTDATEFIQRGASAVQVATRFTVTEESGLPEQVKQKYFGALEEDVVVNEFSPTGYLMRMLKNSPCLSSNIRPNCEAFGYMLSKEGKCAYIDAYAETGVDERGRKLPVSSKMCLCYHFSRSSCYTCGHNVYRLKDTSVLGADGQYQLLSAQHVIMDYLTSTEHSIKLPAQQCQAVAVC